VSPAKVCLAVQKLGISLELDLWPSVGFLLTRALLWWSSASSGPVVSSYSRVGPSCSACGQHVPGSFLPFLARKGHNLSCPAVVGVDRWFQLLSTAGGLLKMARALHAPIPMTMNPDAGCFVVFWQILVFLFIHSCLCSQFTS
jgi:hypothetical protein